MTNDLTTAPQNPLSALLSDPDRLAAVPVETVERLWAIQREIDQEQARRAYVTAKHAVESECEPVRKAARNNHTKSQYALMQDIDAMLSPLPTAHGFDCEGWGEPMDAPDMVLVKLRLNHTDGHSEVYTLPAPLDHLGPSGQPVKTRLQGTASSLTYSIRHLKTRVFNIETVKDDGDGNKPESAEPIDGGQAVDLLALLSETGADEAKFCAFFGIAKPGQLPAARFREAVQMLERRRGK